VTPMEMLDEYSSDAVRYWAASGRPGTDTAFDVGQMKIGRRLAIKILNATKFVLTITSVGDIAKVTDPIDQAMLAKLATTVESATKAFEDFNYAKALDLTETFFWDFTDNYVELVKERAYGETDGVNSTSAQNALYLALTTLLRLFAPFLPFTTEETWSWFNNGSVHTESWPKVSELSPTSPNFSPTLLATAHEALQLVRKAKSEAKVSMRAVVSRAEFTGPAAVMSDLETVKQDLCSAGSISDFNTGVDTSGSGLTAEITLAQD